MVTKEDLQDEANLAECECGSFAHYDHTVQDYDGRNSCPECQQDWMRSLIDMYKKLLREMADPALTQADIDLRIKTERAALIGITLEELEEIEDE